jgi:hypothetical protein
MLYNKTRKRIQGGGIIQALKHGRDRAKRSDDIRRDPNSPRVPSINAWDYITILYIYNKVTALPRRHRSNQTCQAIRQSNRIRNTTNQAHSARVQEPYINATISVNPENITTAATFKEAITQLNTEAITRDKDRATI